jgi:hypothetical protein
MICYATGHRGCPFKPPVASDESWQSQAFMLRAEVIDTTDKVHPRLQGLAPPGKGSCASGQACKTTALCVQQFSTSTFSTRGSSVPLIRKQDSRPAFPSVNGFGGDPLPNSPQLKAVSAAIWKAVAIATVAVKSPQNETPPSLEVPCDRAGNNRSQG